MAHLTMDNPLTPSPQAQLKKVVADLRDCVSSLKREFEETGCPVTDDSPHLHRFCAKLEFLLQAGFRGKTSLFGDKKEYWNYFLDCIGSTKDLRDGIKFVKANSELRTSLGRGRAFLRFALVHQRLADTIQQCVCSTKQTNDWYHSRAVWLQPALTSTIINDLYDLNDIQFDLAPRGYDLDTTWPTFARKTFNPSSPQTWAPPSRSTSISSLASLPALEIPPSPSAHSATQDHQVEHLQSELNDSENERFSLQVKVETLKESRDMASNRVEELEKKVRELQKDCNDYDVKCQSLQQELKLKEATWAEKEISYKAQVEVADQNMAHLRNQLSNGSTASMNIAELMAKLALQQKQNATLQIELKTSNLELQSKTQTDAGKTKLIELLDKKIEQLQGQNQRMLVQIENCADDRKRDAEGNKSSHTLIEATMDRLKRADAINAQLQKANEALRKMLESMEEKSQKISTLAKEKLVLYKNENTKLQLTVQQLTKQLAVIKAKGGSDAPAESGGDGGEDTVAQAIETVLESTRKDVDMWKAKYEELHAEYEKLKAAPIVERSESLSDKAAAGEASAKVIELEKEKAETEKALKESREEVKKILIERMNIDEEATLVEARQKETKGRHEELLKQLAFKESELRKLELQMSKVNAVVDAAESGKEAAESTQEVDTSEEEPPLVVRLKNIVREKSQMQAEFRKMDVHNISLRKDLETKEKQVEELNSDVIRFQLQVAELKTLVSKTEVESANMASKIEVYQASASGKNTSNGESDRETLLLEIESKDSRILKLENQLQEQKQRFEEEKPKMSSDKSTEESKDVIRGLEDKLAEFRERYDYLMEEKVTLESKCRDLETKLKTTKQNLKKADKENKKLLGERDSLRKESEELKKQVETLTLTVESLTTQLAELESNIMKSVEGKLTSLQNNIEKEQAGRKQLESDLENLRGRHVANEKLLEQLQKKKQEQEQEYKSKLKKKQEELESWKKENDLLEKKLEVVTARFEQASTQEESTREELKMDLDLLQCDLTAANTELDNERLLIKDTEELLMSAFNELLGGAKPPAENSSIKALTTTMIKDLKDMQVKMTDKSTELEKALTDIEANAKTIRELEEAAVASEADKEDLHSKMDAANFDVIDLKEQLSNAHSTQLELDAEIEGLNQKIAEFITEAGVNTDKIKALQLQLSEHEVSLVSTNTLRAELESALDELRQTSATTQSQWDTEKENLNRTIEELTSGAGDAGTEITALKLKLSEKDSQLESAHTLKAELESAMANLKQTSSATETEWNTEKENLNKKIAELTAGSSSEISNLKTKISEQESQVESGLNIKAELESTITTLKQNFSTTETEWNTEKENLNKKIADLIAGAGGSSEEIFSLKSKISEQESQLKEAYTLQEKKDAELASLQQTQEERDVQMVSLHQTLEERDADAASLKQTLEKQEAEFSSVKEGLQQEVSALRFELSSQQMEHQQALQGLEGHASSMADLVGKLSAQESLIDMLEKDLEQLKRERLLEKNRTLNELEELRQSLSGRDEECKLLNSELKRTSMLLDEERNLSLRFKNELSEVRAFYDRELGQSRREVEVLRKDTDVLKQQLIKIIKDKDELWQKTDKLEYLQKLTVAGSWMEDTDTTQCLNCKATFSFMLRKHHCRLCGRIFCYSCCNQWVMTPHSSKKTRICNDCALYHKSEMEKPSNEGEDQDVPSEEKLTESSHLLPPGDVPGVGAGQLDDTTEDEDAPSSFRPEPDSDDGFFTSSREDQAQPKVGLAGSLQPDSLGVSPATDAVLDTSEEPEVTVKTGSKVSGGTPKKTQQGAKDKKSAHQSDADVDDENYDVITQEEIVQSMHESMVEPDSHTVTSPMLTVEQIAAGGPTPDPGLTVRAGRSYLVPVFIDAPGIVLCWDFSTEPKGIHFSVTFRRDALTSNDLAEVLIPLCPCNSHRQAVQGELIAVKPGLYTLVFDNSTSRLTSKKLNYHLRVKKPEAAD